MYAILCTEGQMEIEDIKSECREEKWVPLFVYRENNNTVIPLFKDPQVAKSFVKRNFPKNWIKGAFEMSDDDYKKIKEKGWEIKEFNYPNKIKDIKNISFDIEILYLDEKPALRIN